MIFKNGYRITQRFGENPDYYKKYGFKGHEGLDIVPRSGSRDILAVEGGKVVRDIDRPRNNYGLYTVVLNLSKRRAWWYCHLKSNSVSYGDKINAGQKIGVMGATGKVTGPHLHLGIRLCDSDGNAINTDNGYKGFLDPLHFLEGEQMDKYYKGIDLTNEESVKVCIDTWKDVIDGKYVKKETYENLKQEFKKEREAFKVRIKEEEKRYQSFKRRLAEKLDTKQEEPAILEEITKAIGVEDEVTTLKNKNKKQRERLDTLEKENKRLRKELSKSESLKIDKFKWYELIIKGILKFPK